MSELVYVEVKGDCFSVAGRAILDNPFLTLCHARVAGEGELKGRRIWHAWTELHDVVFDFSNGNKVITRKENYYKRAQIKEEDVIKYPHDEAIRLMCKHKYFGLYPEGFDKNG